MAEALVVDVDHSLLEEDIAVAIEEIEAGVSHHTSLQMSIGRTDWKWYDRRERTTTCVDFLSKRQGILQ